MTRLRPFLIVATLVALPLMTSGAAKPPGLAALGTSTEVAGIDIDALRAERERRAGHNMMGHLRTEAYPQQRRPVYPRAGTPPTIEGNDAAIERGKAAFDRLREEPRPQGSE